MRNISGFIDVFAFEVNIGKYAKVEDCDTLFLCTFATAMRMIIVQ